MCLGEMVSAVSVCRGRGAASAPLRAGSRASGPEELAERQSSYFPYTSSHIQPCSPYLTKHLHPAVQQRHKRRWGRTASLCMCACVRVFGNGLRLRISHHISNFCILSTTLSCQLRRKLINQVCLEEKTKQNKKTKNKLTHSALRQGHRVTPCHSERRKKDDKQ